MYLNFKHRVLRFGKKFNQRNRKPEHCPKLLKSQKTAPDFYLFVSPYTQIERTPETRREMTEWQCEVCHPQGNNRPSTASPTMSPWAHLKSLQQQRAWFGSQSWCGTIRFHGFVRQDKCTCRKSYTMVLTPISYHPANWGNNNSLHQLGLC